MGGSPDAEMRVVEYYMSIHMGICTEVDEILGIWVGEKAAWNGIMDRQGSIPIAAGQLFGGNKSEGGVSGIAYYLPGDPNQTLPEELAAKFGLTSATCPGFRGLASVFFTGTSVEGAWVPASNTNASGSGGGGTGGDLGDDLYVDPGGGTSYEDLFGGGAGGGGVDDPFRPGRPTWPGDDSDSPFEDDGLGDGIGGGGF